MTRFALLLAFACLLLCTPAHAVPQRRPNVILVVIDDMGVGDLSCHGNPHVQTPCIDAFAEKSVEFERFYVSPMCSPTRASLMTGRWHFRTGVYDTRKPGCELNRNEVTVAQLLRDGGYATGIFGKWHLGHGVGLDPNDRGFDESLTFHTWDGAGLLPEYTDPVLSRNGVPEQCRGYCHDIWTDAAIDFMRRHRERPFFIYLPANILHTPLQVPSDLMAGLDRLGIDHATQKIAAMTRSVDANFGRLLAALDELALDQDTLVVFTADNGPSPESTDRFVAGLHGWKGTVYENGIRVPCFLRWPAGLSRPARVNRIAAHVDFLPTVLDACGLLPPAGVAIDGVSLLPLARGAAPEWPERAFVIPQSFSRSPPGTNYSYAVITDTWKLVQPTGGRWCPDEKYAALCRKQDRGERSLLGPVRYELYEIATDARETADVARDHPDVVTRLQQVHDRWIADVGMPAAAAGRPAR